MIFQLLETVSTKQSCSLGKHPILVANEKYKNPKETELGERVATGEDTYSSTKKLPQGALFVPFMQQSREAEDTVFF